MKVFERIQEYLTGEEIQKETRARLKYVYGDEFHEGLVKEETDTVARYFKKDGYETPFVDFELLVDIFADLKLSYHESAQVLAFILNENAKLIESFSEDKLNAYVFAIHLGPLYSMQSIRNYKEKLSEYPSVIRKYIDKTGAFLPVDVTDSDKNTLKNIAFSLYDNQIDNILFFCKKKFEKSPRINTPKSIDNSPQIKIETMDNSPKKKETNSSQLTSKQLKKLYKEITKYLNADWKPCKYLSDEEIASLKMILDKVYMNLSKEEKDAKIAAIIELVYKSNHKFIKNKEIEEESKYLEKLDEIRFETFKNCEYEQITYDIALNIARTKDFAYPQIQADIIEQLTCIDECLEEIFNAKEKYEDLAGSSQQAEAYQNYLTIKFDNASLIKLCFSELYDILNNYSLIDDSFKRGRKKAVSNNNNN